MKILKLNFYQFNSSLANFTQKNSRQIVWYLKFYSVLQIVMNYRVFQTNLNTFHFQKVKFPKTRKSIARKVTR